jgi:hypothetical protein
MQNDIVAPEDITGHDENNFEIYVCSEETGIVQCCYVLMWGPLEAIFQHARGLRDTFGPWAMCLSGIVVLTSTGHKFNMTQIGLLHQKWNLHT